MSASKGQLDSLSGQTFASNSFVYATGVSGKTASQADYYASKFSTITATLGVPVTPDTAYSTSTVKVISVNNAANTVILAQYLTANDGGTYSMGQTTKQVVAVMGDSLLLADLYNPPGVLTIAGFRLYALGSANLASETGQTLTWSASGTYGGGSVTPVTPVDPPVVSVTMITDQVTATLPDVGNTCTVTRVETLRGGAGADCVTLGEGGSTITMSGVETLLGSATDGDWVNLAGDNTVILAGIETLIGGNGHDRVDLGNRGNTMILAGIETLVGGSGNDAISLGARGNTMILAGIETLTGGTGNDWVNLGARGNTMVVSGVETLIGGSGQDRIDLRGSNTLITAGVETLIGGEGADLIRLGNRGGTITMTAVETLVGGSGGDWVNLGNRGNTMTVSGIETLIGGANADAITLAAGGTTMILTAVETLAGGGGTDVIALGSRGNTMVVANVETLVGGARTDDVTVTGGAINFAGNGGADHLVLNVSGLTDTVVFNSADDGAAAGTTSGFDTIAGFEAGRDKIVLEGTAVTSSVLPPTVAVGALADANFTAFRSALGSVAAGEDAFVLATDGANTGLYHIGDTNLDRVVGASEVKLLAVFTGAVLSPSSF